jgi:hypothetical protein
MEVALALAFVAAMLFAGPIIRSSDAGGLLRLAAIAAPVTVLTIWFAAYFFAIRSMDELEQAMETRSLAIACGVTIWLVTVLGLSNLAMGTPAPALAFVAPLAAVVFGVTRAIVGIRYR